MRYPEYRLNEIGFRARLYDLNHIPLEKGIAGMIRRVPKVVPYDNDARDADGDGLVQEGTIWERPAGTRWVSKLGSALASGLRAIPGNSKIVDKDGNDVDYKPGDKARGGRAKLRGLLARRRLRRAGRRRRRVERRREEDAERKPSKSFDEQIETLENAANAASQERLIEAEKARGDGPMNAEYRSFWDTFMETFTGINQNESRNSRDNARGKSAIRKALGMEGNRRTAGDENGNEPDHDREQEFDEEALSGKGVMPSAIEEHHRKLKEDPEYRKRWNRALREGRVDQFIEKEGLRPQLVGPEERRPGGGLKPPPGGWEPPSPDRRPRPPRWPRSPDGQRRPRPRIGEERVDTNGDTWVYDGPAEWVDLGGRPSRGGYWKNGWRRKENMRPTDAPPVPDRVIPPEDRDVPEADAPEADVPEADVPEDVDPGSELPDDVIESIEHYRDTILPELSDAELAQELAYLRDALAADDVADRFPRNDGPERFASALQEQRRRLVASRGEGEEDAPPLGPAPGIEEAPEAGRQRTPWTDIELDEATDEDIQSRLIQLVAMDPVGDDAPIAAEVERLKREQRSRWEEANLPGDAFFDNDSWIEGDFAWDDDAIDAAINVALTTDDTRTIEGIERSLQMYKNDMTASEWRGAKGRRYREIQAILDRRREERERPTRTEPSRDVDPYGDDEFGFMSDEELQRHIDDLEDIEDRTPEQEARLEALGNEYDERFGTEEEQDQAIEDMDLEERLEWYETDPASLSDEELQTEINELNSEEDLDEHAMEWLTKLSNEDDRRQDERLHQEALDERQAAEDEEERRAALVEERRDPREMTPEEMAEEMNAINEADEDELDEHWGSSEAAMDRYNVLQDALSEREEQDARDRDREEIEDRVAEQDDPRDMSPQDIAEEMSELFDISEDDDYTEEAKEEAQERWNLLSAEQDRREMEREQDERDLSDALDERQAEEDAEADRIREAEEQEAEAAVEAEAAREAEMEAEERQVRVEEHENNPPDSLSEEDLANEIAELSDSEIMDDLDRDRLNDLETEVERRMEVAARTADKNRGERNRGLRGRSKESLQEELDELMEADGDEDRMDALEAELDRRERVRSRDTRERTRERTDELEAAEQREYEGEGEDDEETLLPEREPDYSDEDDEDAGGPTDGDLADPYAEIERDMTTPPPDEEDEEDDIDESGARPIGEGGSGPNGEWTDADEAADPAEDRFAELEDKLDGLDWNIHAAMAAGDDEQVLGYLLRREEYLEDDGGLIGTHREIMRHEHDAEILRYLVEHEYKDGQKAREDGGPNREHYENNQKYLNVYAEAQKRGLLDPVDPDPVDDSPEADLPDPLEGKTPESAEAEEAIRRDWDGYSPEEKEYLVHSFLDTRMKETQAELVAHYKRRGQVTVIDLPEDASPELKAIQARQLEIQDAKSAVYEVMANRVLSGVLDGQNIEGTKRDSDQLQEMTDGLPIHSVLLHHSLAGVDRQDMDLHLRALGLPTGTVSGRVGITAVDAEGNYLYQIPEAYVEKLLERNKLVTTLTTDAQLKEAVAELELMTDGLGELAKAELIRALAEDRVRGIDEGAFGGSADQRLRELLHHVYLAGGARALQRDHNWREQVNKHWRTMAEGINSAFRGQNNLKRALTVVGEGAIEDLGLSHLITDKRHLHNIDSLSKQIIGAWLLQFEGGEIDEGTFVSNVENLPYDLRKSFLKHTGAAKAEARGGTDARRSRHVIDAFFDGDLKGEDSITVFETAVDFAFISHHNRVHDLAVDGKIDVAIPETDQDIVRGLIRSMRPISSAERQNMGVDAEGRSVKHWDMNNKHPVTGAPLPTRRLDAASQILKQRTLDQATDALFPDDWIAFSNETGEVSFVRSDLGRASYGDSTGISALTRDLPVGAKIAEATGPAGAGQLDVSVNSSWDVSTAGHEMVHRIQAIIPLLLLLDNALAERLVTPGPDDDPTDPIWQRTSLGKIFGQEAMDEEFGIPDHLSMPYMGKGYESRMGEMRWEVSSVGVELLLGGEIDAFARGVENRHLGGYTLADALAEDRSSSWIGHVLAMLISI